ncbi:hypothetical protein [Anaeromyxobacter oryzae]|uniref:Uncharacterized protein n=1 Tax=Anaeromyxobacter oryzae TaxID=2918170 RepID=A0ABM7WWN9_9BACT|nr:hypothetical protein [Anaeromyxobacter oryzae]BDG03909.1 hypothetical protein AMOR_29050 [Anaeromyxobacter oryzae]
MNGGGDPITRERARAVAARKVLPWVVASALGAAALVKVAGATWGGAAGVLGAGVLLAVFVSTLAVARCPECGRRLPRPGAEPAAAGGGARLKGCARCGAA